MGLLDSVNGLLGRVSDPRISGGLLSVGSGLLQAGSRGQGLGSALGQAGQNLQQFNADYTDRQQRGQYLDGQQQLQQQQIQQGQYQQEQQTAAQAQQGQLRQKAAELAAALPENSPIRQILNVDPMAGLELYSKVIAEHQKPIDQPSAVREYEYAKSQGYAGTFQQFKNDGARAGATSINLNTGVPATGGISAKLFPESTTGIKAPAGFGFNQADELVALKGGDKDPNNIAAATEGERKDAFNYTRLLDAERTLSNPDYKGFETPEIGASIVAATLGSSLGNAATSPKRQIYEGASADAVDAALTLATGAAYTEAQLVAQRKAYLPQFGDSQATIAEKLAKRGALMSAAKARSGRAVGSVPDYLANPSGGNKPVARRFNPATGRLE